MRTRYHLASLSLALAAGLLAAFALPSSDEQRSAIGPTRGLSAVEKRAFAPSPAFRPIPKPGPGDWLTVHKEQPQSYGAYLKSKPPRPTSARRTIYLQPLGVFPEEHAGLLDTVKDCAEAYFMLPVKLLPASTPGARAITSRKNPASGIHQLLTTDILAMLKKSKPDDAFCILAITMEDLYPEDSWNFVFGQASLRDGVGVYSFARYDSAFYGIPRDKDYKKTMTRRSCQVLVHETTHMFGITHCVYFSCLINGANSLAESDAQPMHLCPVCLRKLHHAARFDLVERYRGLNSFYEEAGLDFEAQWTALRVAELLETMPPQ